MAPGEGVADEAGQRRPSENRVLGRGGYRCPDKRARRKDEWVLGIERVGIERAVPIEQVGAEADAPDEGAQDLVRKLFVPALAARKLHMEDATTIAVTVSHQSSTVV